MPRLRTSRSDYHQPQYHNDYRRRVPPETDNTKQPVRINNFDFKDYNRPLSYPRNSYNKSTTNHKESPAAAAPRQQRRDYDPYQIDERTFHRRRNFTNTQFQQQDNISKFNNPSNRRRSDNPFKDGGTNRDLRKYDSYENKNHLPPRLQINNNYRNLTQKQHYQRR
jgi:hypothetical protein